MVRAEFSPCVWLDVVHSDIKFGYLDIPTTDDTEHNTAQFEICCQKWFDISENEYGLSVLNCAKSGLMAKKGIVSINLLRPTNYPCTDFEHKQVSYLCAIYPHNGGFSPVKIDDMASVFNLKALYEKNVLIPLR